MALAAGAKPEHISFGNTIKKQVDIAAAYALGVRLYAFDSEAELNKLAAAAPGAQVFCRILTSGVGADWPLSRKFGCDVAMAESLLRAAPGKGLTPVGVSFHVGSQQRDPEQWDSALAEAADLFRRLEADGVYLTLVNLGGGLRCGDPRCFGAPFWQPPARDDHRTGARHGRQCRHHPDRGRFDLSQVGQR